MCGLLRMSTLKRNGDAPLILHTPRRSLPPRSRHRRPDARRVGLGLERPLVLCPLADGVVHDHLVEHRRRRRQVAAALELWGAPEQQQEAEVESN